MTSLGRRQDPTQQRRRPEAIDHRLRERIADRIMRALVRTVGLRPFLLPSSVIDQLVFMGLRGDGFVQALSEIRSLADWPYVWEAEADKRAAEGDWLTAATLYYLAQRIMIEPSPLKERLYSSTKRAYLRVDHPAPIEHVRFRHAHHSVAGYLQVPQPRRRGEELPLVVMVPGVTATKEELHRFANAMVKRRYAVCRIDNAGYGDTLGILNDDTRLIGAAAAEAVASDPRIDRHRIHFFGMSLGGFWSLHAAAEFPSASVSTISSPLSPHKFIVNLPTPYLKALSHMTGGGTAWSLFDLIERLDMAPRIDRIVQPVRLFHGDRDNVIPSSEMFEMARRLDDNVVGTLFRGQYHTCLGVADRILAETLVWMDDPWASLQKFRGRRRVLRRGAPFRRLGAPVILHSPGSLIQTAARLEGTY